MTAGGNSNRPGAMSYEDLLLGLTVNADTYDLEEEHRPPPSCNSKSGLKQEEEGAIPPDKLPFDVSQIASFDFTLNPSNFSTRLGKGSHTAFLDWWHIQSWYPYNTNLVDVYEKKHGKTFRPLSLIQRCKFNPYEGKRAVRVPSTTTKVNCEGKLAILKRDSGIVLRPVEVDGDGNCLVHSASVGLTGTQRYFDALRFAIYRELRDHRDHYLNVGVCTEEYKARFEGLLAQAQEEAARQPGLEKQAEQFRLARENLLTLKTDQHTRPRYSAADVTKALQQVRPCLGEVVPQEKYLEEIHLTALANVLRRPIILLAGEYEGGFFLPSRLDPHECCCTTTDDSGPPPQPPFMIHFLGLHYEHLALQREEDYWTWAQETIGHRYPDCMDVLRRYGDSMLCHPRNDQKRRMPEFVEELLMYALAHAALAIEKKLEADNVNKADRSSLHDAFGVPDLFHTVLKPALGEELTEVRCPDGVIDHPEMNAAFNALGVEVRQDGDSHFMHVVLERVNVDKMRLLVWGLYALQGTPLQSNDITRPGVLRTEDNLDSEVFDLVLNGVNEPIVDLGVAHLYAPLYGFDFNTMSRPHRNPCQFVESDERRLRIKFSKLTGCCSLGSVMAEDVERMRREKVDISEIRMLYTQQKGAFTRVPTGLLAMLKVASERAYPGLSLVHSSQVVLLDYCYYGDDGDGGDGPRRKDDVALSDIPLDNAAQRSSLLSQLCERYGLVQDSPAYEAACCSVAMPHRFSTQRARAVVLEWMVTSMRHGARNIKKLFLPGSPVLISQLRLTPTCLLPPVDETAEERMALEGCGDGGTDGVLSSSSSSSALAGGPSLATIITPTSSSKLRATTPTTQEEVKIGSQWGSSNSINKDGGGDDDDDLDVTRHHHPHLHHVGDDDDDDGDHTPMEQELSMLPSPPSPPSPSPTPPHRVDTPHHHQHIINNNNNNHHNMMMTAPPTPTTTAPASATTTTTAAHMLLLSSPSSTATTTAAPSLLCVLPPTGLVDEQKDTASAANSPTGPDKGEEDDEGLRKRNKGSDGGEAGKAAPAVVMVEVDGGPQE